MGAWCKSVEHLQTCHNGSEGKLWHCLDMVVFVFRRVWAVTMFFHLQFNINPLGKVSQVFPGLSSRWRRSSNSNIRLRKDRRLRVHQDGRLVKLRDILLDVEVGMVICERNVSGHNCSWRHCLSIIIDEKLMDNFSGLNSLTRDNWRRAGLQEYSLIEWIILRSCRKWIPHIYRGRSLEIRERLALREFTLNGLTWLIILFQYLH